MKTGLELLEQLVHDAGSAREAASMLGISEQVISMYRKQKKQVGPSLREKLRELGYDDSNDGKAEQLRQYRMQIKKIVDTLEDEVQLLQTMTEKKIEQLKEAKLTLLYADTLSEHPNYTAAAEPKTDYTP